MRVRLLDLVTAGVVLFALGLMLGAAISPAARTVAELEQTRADYDRCWVANEISLIVAQRAVAAYADRNRREVAPHMPLDEYIRRSADLDRLTRQVTLTSSGVEFR